MTSSLQPLDGGETFWQRRRLLLCWAGWFFAANTVLVGVACLRCLQVAGWPQNGLARWFLVVGALGHFAALALVPLPLAAGLIVAWPKRGWAFGVGVFLATVLVLTLAVDGIVYRLYRFHLNGMVWSLITEGGMFEILPISANTWITVGVLVAGAIGVEVGLAWVMWRWVRAPSRGGRLVAVGLVVLNLVGQGLHAYADAVENVAVMRMARCFPAFRPLTVKRRLRKLGWLPDRRDPAVKLDSGGTHLRYPLESLTCKPPERPLNVVMLVIDSWRQDMLKPEVTPAMWKFSERALRFERHNAVANATRYGIFSLLYGIYGSYWPMMLAEQRGPVLIDALDRAGYQFGVWGSARLTSPEFDRTVFAQIRDRIDLAVPGRDAVERDREIQRRFLSFLDRRDTNRPFFAFVFYDSPHAYLYPPDAAAPFQPAPEAIDHLKLNARTDPVPVKNKYMNAVHWVDGLVGEVLGRLESSGLLERTVLMLTADHGEEFNDSGGNYWGHNSNFARFQTDVPLVVHWPGRSAGRVEYLTTHLDIAPTLLQSVLGCTTPTDRYSLGYSLFDGRERYPLAAASWNQLALVTTNRVDMMSDMGPIEHLDLNGKEIETPLPRGDLQRVLEGMARFQAK